MTDDPQYADSIRFFRCVEKTCPCGGSLKIEMFRGDTSIARASMPPEYVGEVLEQVGREFGFTIARLQ